MMRRKSWLLVGLLLVGGSRAARADFIVSPGTDAGVEGNFENAWPFNLGAFGVSSMRYQQVYGASDFSSLTGPQLISQLAFRPDATYGSAFSSTLPDIQINLSTIALAPDTLNPTYAANVGANDTVVYNRGALPLSSSFTGPAGGPKNFDIVINLTTPFLYNPSAGNLLLDVRNFGGGTTTFFDAQNTSGDTVSRVFGGTVGAATGATDTTGLVTRFTVAPVPEPSTYAMMALGLGFLGLATRRKKMRAGAK